MTINWTTNCWVQERNILTLSNFSTGTTHILLTVSGHSELSAKYVVPSSGTLQIDLSDLVRMYANGSFTVTEQGGQSQATETQPWNMRGLINPSSVIIPKNENAPSFLRVSPPSMMLQNITNSTVLFEMYSTAAQPYAQGRVKSIPSGTVANFMQENEIVANSTAVELWRLNTELLQRIELKELFDCKTYVAVEWVSFTGRTRRHTFEVIKQTIETKDAVGLQTIDNQYDERKGRRDGFTLRLEGLNRYDFWYYADLVTSSQVKVSFNGTTWTQVQVTSKSVEIPNNDEGALNTLEIALNYKQYDTI